MNIDIKLYNEIYSNAELARDITGRLIRRCRDASLRKAMADQFAEYHAILLEAGEALAKAAEAPEEYSRMMRYPIYCGMRMNLAADSTSSHIAEMLVQGSAMGLIDIARALNAFQEAELGARALAERLQGAEEGNIRRLLAFL